jgi:AcrR family transcriptional regulator
VTQPDTKQRILAIAGELFARQGYTGTTIADIARELGTTTAALYYHFPSKAAILGGLIAKPLTGYSRLLESLDSGDTTPEQLLAAIVEITAESRDLATILDRDPAAVAMIDEQLPRSSGEMIAQTIAALAGPDASHAALIRANAALAVVKAATFAAIDLGGGELSQDDRSEVLALALRTLKELFRTNPWRLSKGHASGRFRRGSGSGHDEHQVHDLRPRGQRGRQAPARAPANPAEGRLGGARPGRDLGAHPDGHRDHNECRRPVLRRPGRPRDREPAGNHCRVESAPGRTIDGRPAAPAGRRRSTAPSIG